ncbi:MAG: thiaminase II [Barnesiella sp.]|nr:thiaminase II [Barnesiella sp.]
MKKWSEEAWAAALPLVEKIKELPFLRELSEGSLAPEIFRFYISQDNLYINEYSRVLAHIASRLPEMADVETFLGFAAAGVAVEKELHAMYDPDPTLRKSDACEFYTSYLRARSQADVAVEAAAILPCFWVYLEVGKYILSTARLEGNRYGAWIGTYSDPAFDESTRKAIDVCDRLAAAAPEHIRRQMTDTFIDCTRLEMLFWESAYRCGKADTELLTTR